eukprot:gb/GECH01015033.1/.p1 GENE.gb/GECH01015033.1/~~gb/GECH01015033.1/.p1  ORF type:complete len:1229 (+),score=320.41 gb/GECH01015033.1/:1-3687(+)
MSEFSSSYSNHSDWSSVSQQIKSSSDNDDLLRTLALLDNELNSGNHNKYSTPTEITQSEESSTESEDELGEVLGLGSMRQDIRKRFHERRKSNMYGMENNDTPDTYEAKDAIEQPSDSSMDIISFTHEAKPSDNESESVENSSERNSPEAENNKENINGYHEKEDLNSNEEKNDHAQEYWNSKSIHDILGKSKSKTKSKSNSKQKNVQPFAMHKSFIEEEIANSTKYLNEQLELSKKQESKLQNLNTELESRLEKLEEEKENLLNEKRELESQLGNEDQRKGQEPSESSSNVLTENRDIQANENHVQIEQEDTQVQTSSGSLSLNESTDDDTRSDESNPNTEETEETEDMGSTTDDSSFSYEGEDKDSVIRTLEEIAMTKQEEIDAIKETLDEIKERNKQLNLDIIEKQKKIDSMNANEEEKIKKLENDQKETQQKLEKTRQEKLDSTVELEKALSEKSETIAKLESRLEETPTHSFQESSDLNKTLQNKEEQINHLNNEIDQLNQVKSETMAELKNVESQKEEIQKRLEDSENEKKELEEKIEEMESSKNSLENKVESLSSLLENKTQEIQKLENYIDENQSDITQKNEQINQIQEELSENKAQQNQTEQLLEEKIRELDHLQSNLESRDEQIAELQKSKIKSEVLEDTVEDLKKEIETLEIEKSEKKTELNKQEESYKNLQKELDCTNQKISETNQDLDSKKQRLEEYSDLIETKDSTISSLKESLETSEEKMYEKSKHIDDLKRENLEKNNKIKEYETSLSSQVALSKQFKEKNDRFKQQSSLFWNALKTFSKQQDSNLLIQEMRTLVKDVDKEKDDENLVEAVKYLNSVFRDLGNQISEMKQKYRKEAQERRKHFNALQEMRGNIRVFCRVRPLLTHESKTEEFVPRFPEENTISVVSTANDRNKEHSFEFDQVFTPEADQKSLFNELRSLVISIMDGFHVCIFAYGQTGSGKTYTMEGPDGNPGINYRTLNDLFETVAEREDYEYEISVSVMEIYMEQLIDLLNSEKQKKLDIRQRNGKIVVPDLTQKKVSSVEEVMQTLEKGYKNRSKGRTNMNEHSSRSHCILQVNVEGFNKVTQIRSHGKLYLIDLAGSERLQRTQAEGKQLREAQAINASLAALGNTIEKLSSKSSHVPYRDSKLTYLLQDSLGGNSKTLMIVNISPTETSTGETLCSLNFASRIRAVEVGPAKRVLSKANNLSRLDVSSPRSRQRPSFSPLAFEHSSN